MPITTALNCISEKQQQHYTIIINDKELRSHLTIVTWNEQDSNGRYQPHNGLDWNCGKEWTRQWSHCRPDRGWEDTHSCLSFSCYLKLNSKANGRSVIREQKYTSENIISHVLNYCWWACEAGKTLSGVYKFELLWFYKYIMWTYVCQNSSRGTY